MKRCIIAAAVAALSFGIQAAGLDAYVQKGLVAQWDGVRNQGAGLEHSADATTWVDCVGGRTFSLTGVTIGENCLQFTGTTSSYGFLDAAGTQAVFEEYGPTGTIEIAVMETKSANSIVLKSTFASGVAIGWTSNSGTILSTSDGSNNPTLLNHKPETYLNKFYVISPNYTKKAYAATAYVNGELKKATGSSYWGTDVSGTYIGRRGGGATNSENPYTGKIYAIRVYDHNLTAEEAAQNYAVDVERFVEGDVSGDTLRVEGAPEACGEVSPGYGVTNGLAAGASFVCSAPSSEVDLGDGRFATCIGYNLYTNRFDATDEWLPWMAGEGTTVTYTYPSTQAKLVWNWKIKAPLGVENPTYVSSAFGSSIVAATVTGIGMTASSATLTFHFGVTEDCADGTVEVMVDNAGEWTATLPHLQSGQNYYVKATLSNTTGESVESDVFDFVQPEVAEPGDISSASYIKTGLVGQWDGIDNVIVNGVRTHSDAPDKWYDLSGNGFDGTFASPTTLTWSENCWANATDSVKPVLLPVKHSARLANKIFTAEFLVEPSYDTDRFGFFSQWNGTKGFGLEQTDSGYFRIGYWSSLPITADYNPTEYVKYVPKDQKTAVTYTVSNAVHTIYINGVKQWTATGGNANLAIAGDVQICVGGEPSTRTSMTFRGKWYSLRTYDRALSAAEVAANYQVDDARFVKGIRMNFPLVLQNGQFVLTVPASDSVRTAVLCWGETYGGTNGWTTISDAVTIPAGATTVNLGVPVNWGTTEFFARARIGEGGAAVWSTSCIWQDPNIPAVVLGSLDGVGGDTLLVKGKVDSLGGSSCTLKVLVGTSEDELTEEWTGVVGSVLTEAGDFTLSLFDGDKTHSRYLTPGETYFVKVVATGANGKVAWSNVKSVTMAKKAAFGASSAAVSGHTMTVTASMKELGMTGATTVELWVGESASSLAKTDSRVVTAANENFTLTATLEKFEKNYFWQLNAVNTSAGATETVTEETATATKSAPDTATYTWTGAGADNKWSNPDNWSDNKSGDCLGYPQSANATAKFNKNADIEIDLQRNGTTVNVGSLNLGTADIDVRFHSADTNGFGLVLGGLTVPGKNARWTLDHAFVYRAADLTWSAGSTILLKNAANLYINNCNMANNAGVSVVLRDESWLSCNAIYLGNGSTTVIDNSTLWTRNHDYLGNKAGEALVRFEGTHPLWWHNNKDGYFYSGTETTDMHFDFFVPVEGYDAAPIQCVANQTKLAGNNNTTPGAGKLTVNVLPDSPAARVDRNYEVDLISWAKGINTSVFDWGALPVEVSGAAFVWSEEENPKTLSARFVGSTHTDRLTVTGVPEELVGNAISPAYGPHDGQTPISLTAPAEPTTYDGDTRRATCLGWKLYDVDPATQIAGATPVDSGTENTYEWTNDGKWQKFVWQWKREVKVTAAAGTGGSVGPATGWAAEDAAFTVTATPETGYRFYKWMGDVPRQKMFNVELSDIFRKPTSIAAVFVSDGALTERTAAQAGDWSNAETWGGTVPGAGDKVVIDGVTVSVSGAEDLIVGAIEVKNGGALRIWGADADATKPSPTTVVPLTGIAAESELLLDVIGDFTVDGASWVSVGGRNADYRVFVNVGGNLALGENAKFAVYAGAVEPDADDVEKYMGDGAAVNVGSNLTTAADAWIYPFAHGVKGSNVRFSVGGDVEIAAGGGFNADGKGYQNPNGPGYFYYAGNGDGGSYGGIGGTGAGEGGKTRTYGFDYGYAFAPFMVGSSGNPGGSGGGAIRLHVAGDVTLEGSLKANGMVTGDTAVMANKSGCGSGGSIWVTCAEFHPGVGAETSAMGASGNTTDSGGPSGNWRGGGGGGRIAIVTGGVRDALLDELYATGACSDLIVIADDAIDPSKCDYASHIAIRGGYAPRLACYGTRGTAVVLANPGNARPIKVSLEPAFDTYESIVLSPLAGMSLLEGEMTATASGTNFVAGTDHRERRVFTGYVYSNTVSTISTGSTVPSVTVNSADGASLFLTWKFAQLEKLLRITFDPTRGSIDGYENEGWYVDGTTATVTAVPAEGWRFLAWTGEVDVEDSGDSPLLLAMDVPYDIEAVFVPSATAESLAATKGGEWFDAATWGGMAVPDENTDVIIDGQTVYLPGVVNVQAKSITVRNGGKLRLWGLGDDLLSITPMFTTCEGMLTATISGDVTVEGANSWISVGGRNSGYRVDLTVGGNLTLGANGKLAVYGGAVEPDAKDVEKYMGDGAKVTVASNLTTAAGAWIYPFAHGVKGSNVRFTVGGDVEIAAGSGFNADGKGYQYPNGPGFHWTSGWSEGHGGSYGGLALWSNYAKAEGVTYGFAYAPFMVGSPGRQGGGPTVVENGNGETGGGAIRIHAGGDVTLNGMLTANSELGRLTSGAGSGGGIWITCTEFNVGGTAVIRAIGDNSSYGLSGPGGGGRVAILTGGCDDEMLAEFYATGESTNENLRVVTTNVNDSAEYAYPNLIDIRGGSHGSNVADSGTGAILLNLGNSRPITVTVEPAAGTMENLTVSPSVGLTTVEGEVTATITTPNFVVGTNQRERRHLTKHVYANETETLHEGPEASCTVSSADGNDLTLAWTFGRLEKLIRVTADANCGTVTGVENEGWYVDGTTATVTAHPAEGWRFLAWTGDVPKRCATENPLSLTMNVPRDVRAVFVPTASPAALTATQSGDWFDTATWGGAGVPGPDTAVTIESNKNLMVEMTLPMDVSVKSITLAGQGMLRLWGEDATATPSPTTVNALGADKIDPSFAGTLTLTVAESVTIGGKAWMSVGGKGSNYRPQVAVGRDLVLDGTSAGFAVYAGPKDDANLVEYAKGSCRVNVTRNIVLADKATVYPFSHPTNGAAVVFSAQNVTVGTNAAFKAEKAGYGYCYGPGAYRGVVSGWIEGYGASYGGINARYVSTYPLQPTYGNAYAPFWSGSCGVANESSGVPGGGAIILDVTRQLTLYGWLDANALPAPSGKGSGSGGSVWVRAKRIKIDAGSAKITAKGGSPTYGGSGSSGGGRICMVERVPSETQFAEVVNLGDRDDFPLLKGFDVLCTNLTDAAVLTAAGFDEAYTNVFSAADGTHNNMAFYSESTPGTAVWLRANPAGTVIIVR